MSQGNRSPLQALLVVLAAIGAQTAYQRQVDAAARTPSTEPAAQQNPKEVGPSCPDLSVTGIKDKRALLEYLAALKTASSAKDTDAIAKLVRFPLRVNASPAYTVNNAVELKKAFSAIFDDGILKAITAQQPGEIFCNSQGAMIGNGEVWIDQEGERIGIAAVNPVHVNAATAQTKGGGVVMMCKTSKHLIVIDKKDSSGVFRYRSWNRPKAMAETPDMEVANGSEEVEGTGPCRYTRYRFTKGIVTFEVNDDLACLAEEPPSGD